MAETNKQTITKAWKYLKQKCTQPLQQQINKENRAGKQDFRSTVSFVMPVKSVERYYFPLLIPKKHIMYKTLPGAKNKNKQQKQQQHTEKPPPPQPPLESRPNQELLVKQAFNTGTHCQPKEQAQIEKTENG